jgi:hypothetical protein
MDLFRSPQFASRIQQLIGERHIPGISLTTVQDGEVASAAYGVSSVDSA